MGRPARPVRERFQEKVDRNGPIPEHVPHLGPCAIWTGKPTSDGYGRLRVDGRDYRAHRLSWALEHGLTREQLGDTLILHRCDQRLCVRLDHLFDGDHALNAADRDQKGRANVARGDTHGSRLHPESAQQGGEKRAKLSRDQVLEVRKRYTGLRGQKTALATEYGISKTQVKNILDRTSWRDDHS
jgi:hypothetical protein